MGQSAAQTVTEIEETRERLAHELDELEDRLPAAGTVKRVARIAAGGGVGGSLFWFVVRRMRKRSKGKKDEGMTRAMANGSVPMNVTLKVLPDDLTAKLDDDKTKNWLLGAAGAWAVLRLLELRSLRKMRRSMTA